MSTHSASSASHTSPMPPTSDPLKLFMEDIEKTQTLSGKYVKIQAYLVSLKEEKIKINDLNLPISKQFLDHAIKTLEVEHDFVSEKIKNILNQTGITDVDVLPEEMIRVFQNPSLNQKNTVPQAPQVPMQSQQGLGKQGLGKQGLGKQGLRQQGLRQQGLGQPGLGQQGLLRQQGSLQTKLQQQLIRNQVMQQQLQTDLSHLQQQQRGFQLQQMQMGLVESQMMRPGQLNPQMINPSQMPQPQDLVQQTGQQVFGQKDEEKRPL